MKTSKFNDAETLLFWLHKSHFSYRSLILRKFADAGHDLTTEQYSILVYLWEKRGDPVSQKQIAQALQRKPPSVSRQLDALERQDLVARNAVDKRTNFISLTKAGQKLHDQLGPIVKQAAKELLKDISTDDLRATINTLKSIAKDRS